MSGRANGKRRSISWEMPSREIELSISASLIPHELTPAQECLFSRFYAP